MAKGGKNLALLAIIAVVIALATTSVSLAVYHYSGDIYLDRSRPGYMPDEEEVEQEEEKEEGEYEFQKTGPVTKEVVDEYLEKLDLEVKALDEYDNPFDSSAITDEKLGIGV